jgi:hypothetical protein
MALSTNFNVDPYYDDFNEDKNYHRILFKPGYAVQSRELTQSQTILQDQIKKFGNHMFKTGSVVTDGQVTIQNTAYLNIASSYSNNSILYSNYNKQVIFNAANTKRAYVLTSYDASQTLNEPITFVINQLYGDAFIPNEIIYTANTDSNAVTYYAQVASTYVNTASFTVSPVGNNQTFSINEGVFYYEGYFVKSQAQSVAIDKYSRTGSAILGFEVSEDIVNYTSDTTLLDPAQSSSNYQAPGADRYKISLTLANRPITSTDLTRFIELAQMSGGVPQKVVQTPIYAVIGDELARRTFDESGDYIVKEFEISVAESSANSAYANVALAPGKAYIKGYEFGTIAPTDFSIIKPRTTNFVNNRRINSDYGYYIKVNNLFGNFGTNQYANVNILNIDTGTLKAIMGAGVTATGATAQANIANTIVANAKVKLMTFDSASDVTNANTYIYKVHLTDINTKTIFNTSTGAGYNVKSGSTSTPLSNIGLPDGFPGSAVSDGNTNIYVGATIRITNGPAALIGVAKTIVAYDPASKNVTVDQPYTTAITTSSQFMIDADFSLGESLVVINSAGFLVASANISAATKDLSAKLSVTGTPPTWVRTPIYWQPVVIQDSGSEPLLLKVGEDFVADNTIADFSYSYKRLYQDISFTSGVSSPLSIATGESLQDASTNASKQQYYTIIPKSGTATGFSPGYSLNAFSFSVDTASRTISVTNYAGAPTFTANIYATINSSNPTSKTKTYIRANTTLVAAAGGAASDAFGNGAAYVAPNDGQTQIGSSIIVKTPGVPQYLYVADVESIASIYDFDGTTIDTTSYNAGSYSNVTDRYTVETGQKDSYYDWGAIVLKPGQLAPRGPLLVRYNRFKSSGSGFFNVDSYTRLGPAPTTGVSANTGVDYGQIPIFTSQDGVLYKLADYLDFRPVRRDGTSAATSNFFNLDSEENAVGPKISEPAMDILLDYSYYLGRVDRVILYKDRTFKILQGEPAIQPVVPVEPDGAMTLYILAYPPYLTYPSSTAIQRFGNKRYTMKDIGDLERRIQNLEYYTQLTLAELATLQKNDNSILDDTGLSRPKNGIIVESFMDRTTADITAVDFAAGIDIARKQALCRSNTYYWTLFSNNSTSNYNIEVNGPVLTLASSNTAFIVQNKASRTLNINPFNIVNYIGTVRLDPASDIWKSENRLETQNVDLTGGEEARDAWASLTNTVWGPEELTTGVTAEVLSSSTSAIVSNKKNTKEKSGLTTSGSLLNVRGDVTTIETQKVKEITTVTATKHGVVNTIVPTELTKSLGDRLVNVTIVTYMRQLNVLVVGTKFKPSTTMYSYFDNVNVSDKVARTNRFTFVSDNLKYETAIGNAEPVDFKDATTGATMGIGGIVLTSAKQGYVVSITPTTGYGSWASATGGINIVGRRSGVTTKATIWNHYSGTVRSATTTTIVLDLHAGGSAGTTDYVGQTLYITGGKGKGQSAVISGYTEATRTISISGTWATIPDTTSAYSIGRIETDEAGGTAGVFFIPDATFRTGEKLFRLIDNEFGTIENSRSNGDASFYAQGQVNTVQETTISVLVPNVIRSSVSDSRVVSSTSAVKTVKNTIDVQQNVVVGYYDPLAQTFLVNGNQYPQGIVVDSIRVCFKTKDLTVPVTLQLRPVVNGYPSSSAIYPYAEKTLTPDQVTLCTIPDVTNSTKYTEFKFDVPVLLLPGEHSFVLVSNSNGYEAFVGEHNATDLRTSVKISEQPYTGVLFLSQNGSTWTPDDEKDLMFSIQKRVFSTDVGYAYFETDMTDAGTANTVFDVVQVTSTDAVVNGTDLNYEFSSRMDAGGQHTYLPIIPNLNYSMIDGFGRRVLDWTTGNTTFQVRTTLQTTNQDVTPMLDISRLNFITIENRINNLPLRNNDFVIATAGSGYPTSGGVGTPVNLTITGGGGVGGAAYANVTGAGIVDKIVVTNPGTGYYFSPTIGAIGSGGAVVTYNGEDKVSGGNSLVRYMTKKVQLATGFAAGDLRVYMDCYKPGGSNIQVWYKLLSASDPEAFEFNSWQLMTQLGNVNFISTAIDTFTELTYAPGTYNSGLAQNKATYTKNGTTYDKFMTFAIKVVMYGSSTIDVPKIKNLRVIALPSTNIPQQG